MKATKANKNTLKKSLQRVLEVKIRAGNVPSAYPQEHGIAYYLSKVRCYHTKILSFLILLIVGWAAAEFGIFKTFVFLEKYLSLKWSETAIMWFCSSLAVIVPFFLLMKWIDVQIKPGDKMLRFVTEYKILHHAVKDRGRSFLRAMLDEARNNNTWNEDSDFSRINERFSSTMCWELEKLAKKVVYAEDAHGVESRQRNKLRSKFSDLHTLGQEMGLGVGNEGSYFLEKRDKIRVTVPIREPRITAA